MDGSVKLDGNTLRISFSYDANLVEKARSIHGRSWNPNAKCWSVPISQFEAVQTAFPEFRYDSAIAEKFESARVAAEAAQLEAEKKSCETLALLGDLSAPLPDGKTLYAHQRVGVEMLVRAKFAILADDMGLGKTKQALIAAKAFQIPVYVVAPVSLRDNWLREAAAVEVEIEFFSWAKIPEAPECDFVFVADEAHYAQAGAKTQRGKKFLALAEKAKACFCLTGTPIKNGRPINLLPLLIATRHALAKDVKSYHKRYCDAKSTRFSRWDTTGATNLKELHEKTKDVIIRRMKKDCIDLPAKTRVYKNAELSAEARKQYDETFSQIRAEYRKRLIAGEISDGGEALVMLNHLRHAGSVSKIESAVETAQEIIEQGGQVVIFTEFTESAKQIAGAFRDAGVELLTGETPADARQEMIDRFQSGQSKVFVGTIKAGGVGITLTAAQTVILVDRPWTPGDAMQAEDRLHRIGQNANVTAIWLQSNETDTMIDALLEKKQRNIELVLAGKETEKEESASEILAKIF